MDIHRLVEFDVLVEIVHKRKRVPFGVGLRKFAIRVPRACNETAAEIRLVRVESDPAQRLPGCLDIGVRHVRNDEVLPDREPDFPGPVKIGDLRDPDVICFGVRCPTRNRGSHVIQPLLLLRINADVRMRNFFCPGY